MLRRLFLPSLDAGMCISSSSQITLSLGDFSQHLGLKYISMAGWGREADFGASWVIFKESRRMLRLKEKEMYTLSLIYLA